MRLRIFKYIDKLESENYRLVKAIEEKDHCLMSILEQCRKGHAENLAVAFKYYARIRDLAELGLDINPNIIKEDDD